MFLLKELGFICTLYTDDIIIQSSICLLTVIVALFSPKCFLLCVMETSVVNDAVESRTQASRVGRKRYTYVDTCRIRDGYLKRNAAPHCQCHSSIDCLTVTTFYTSPP